MYVCMYEWVAWLGRTGGFGWGCRGCIFRVWVGREEECVRFFLEVSIGGVLLFFWKVFERCFVPNNLNISTVRLQIWGCKLAMLVLSCDQGKV